MSCRLRAQIAGLQLRELNALEREFLFLLGFRLAVRRDEYDACAAALAAPPVYATCPAPSPSGSAAEQSQPARPHPHDPTGAAASAAGPPHSLSQEARPEPAATPMDFVMSGAHRLCIGDDGRGAECGGGSGCGGEGCGRMLRDGPGPIAPTGPDLMD